jgi:hypothetical protein
MSVKHLSNHPRNLPTLHGEARAWRYEERGGLAVIVPPFNGVTAHLRIPTKLMREFLKRLDAKP